MEIFCDGSSHAKGNLPIGWAWVIVRGDQPLLAGVGCDKEGTNNIAELRAVRDGLRASLTVPKLPGELVVLVSDSQYALGSAAGTYTASKNVDLVAEVRQAAIDAKVDSFKWVKGHSGVVWNERVDSLAHDAKQTLVPAKVKTKQAKRKAAREKSNGTKSTTSTDLP